MSITDTKRAVAVFLVLLATAISWYPPLTELATESADAGLKRSLVSFASARALNGVISVLQGTEVAVHPVGVGVSLSMGEILDPINDLVESLSSVMLMASAAFGIQKLLLAIGSSWVVSAFVTVVALLWSLAFLRHRAPHWLTRLVLALLFVRFAMPATLLGSAYVFERFSAEDYQQSQAVLEGTSVKLKGFALNEAGHDAKQAPSPRVSPPVPAPEAKGSSLLDWMSDRLAAAREKAQDALPSFEDPTNKVKEKYEQLKAAAENAAERMIQLIVVFVMQTVVVPLLLLWGLYRVTVGLPMANGLHGAQQQFGPRGAA